METKHTKGGWEAYYSEFFKTFSIHNDLTSTLICHLNSSLEEAHANAKLMAAAPELLEALMGLIEGIDPEGACRGKFAYFHAKGTKEHDDALKRAYVGSKGILSDEQILKAIEAIKKATE